MSIKKKNRVEYLDIARGIAIFFMFTQHAILMHEYDAGEGADLIGNIFLLLGTAPAAPIFMFIMGVFIMRSSANLNTAISRGLKIFLLGYILNFLRLTLPILIVGPENVALLENETPLELFLMVDILQLAGLSLIAGALLKKYVSPQFYPLIILTIIFTSPFLWGSFNNHWSLMTLWGKGENVIFPFFAWFIFPLLGMYLSRYALNIRQLKDFKKMLIIGVIGTVISLGLMNFFPIGDYSRNHPALNLFLLSFIILWVPLCYWLNQKMKGTWIQKQLLFWSKNVTSIYFIQWLLFGWSLLLFDSNNLSGWKALLIGLAILLITHQIAKLSATKNLFKRLT